MRCVVRRRLRDPRRATGVPTVTRGTCSTAVWEVLRTFSEMRSQGVNASARPTMPAVTRACRGGRPVTGAGRRKIGVARRKARRYHSNMRVNERTVRSLPIATSGDLCNVPCFKEEVVRRLRKTMPSDDELEEARVVFAALADRTRLKVLHALKEGEELCVCDVAHVLGMSVSAASHHLRKLRDLKILKYRNDGKMAYYSVRDRFAGKLVERALGRTA